MLRDNFHACVFCNVAQFLHALLVSFDLRVVRDFEVHIIFVEQGKVFGKHGACTVFVSLLQVLCDFAGKGGNERNDAFAVFLQQFFVHARALVESFRERFRDEREQVAVALIVFRKKHDARALSLLAVAVKPGTREVCVNAQHRMNARFLACFVELDSAVEIAGIGYRKSLHAVLFRLCDQFGHLRECLQEAVMAVRMEMRELAHSLRIPEWGFPGRGTIEL